jgi:hypothetical protein
MKKTGLLVALMLTATFAVSQVSSTATTAVTPEADGLVHTSVNMPFVRFQTPTAADIYCAGFLTRERVPDANYVNGGLQTPTSTKFEIGELVYLAGTGYQAGQLYSVVRELRDINEYEIYPGQNKLLAAAGRPYGEIGRVRVVDTRNRSAIATVEFSCDPIMKLYMNVGSNQGVKVGDYFRVERSYIETLRDPVDSLSFKAQTSEDTQARPPSFEANRFTKTKGPNIHVADLPRRGVGEVVVLNVTPTASSAMVVFALEDVHAGDSVVLDEQQ